MSPEPQMPRDDEDLDDVDTSPETSDTHVPDEDEEMNASVLDEDDGVPPAVEGTSVADIHLRGSEPNPLQSFPAADWTPGQPETFSPAQGAAPAGDDEVQEIPVDHPLSDGDTDAPTVVIKGKRPENAPSNPEFDAATEPLPSTEPEQLDFTPPPSDDEKAAIDFPREERPDALPLPAFEALAPPSLDAPPAQSSRTPPPAASDATPAVADEPPATAVTTGSTGTAADTTLKMPEMGSALPLPTLADAPFNPAQAAPKAAAATAVAAATVGATTPATGTPAAKAPEKVGNDAKVPKARSKGGINLGQVMLLSYASAVTLLLILIMMRSSTGKPHHLESLPDVTPEPENKLSYVPLNATLAPGHTLHLGEKRRFGNIEVEALRVTYEPLQFAHYTGNPTKKKPASDPVLKLWLRFTNVSKDQTISPIDRLLLLRWVAKAGSTTEFSNQYLFPANKANDPTAAISTYRMPQTSDWDLVGQNLDRELAPGESYETFIASADDGTADIKGPITWRIQMRKGFSTKGNGVTTMIEVDFDRKDVRQG